MSIASSVAKSVARAVARSISGNAGGVGFLGEIQVTDNTPDQGDSVTLTWIDLNAASGTLTITDNTPDQGDSVTLEFAPVTYTYQWKKDGVNISGATSNPLVIENVNPTDDDGDYTVAVTNNGITTLFGPESLTVTPAVNPVQWCAYDTFNGTAGTLAGRTAIRGGDWVLNGVGTGGLSLDGSGSLAFGSGDAYMMLDDADTEDDQVITCDCTIGGSSYVAILGRHSQADMSGYWLQCTNGSTVQIIRRIAGAGAYVAQSVGTVSAGTHRLELRISGTTLTAFLDGVEVCSGTDATFASGQVGCNINVSGSTIQTFAASTTAPRVGTPTFVIAGQSNASNRATNHQAWSGTRNAWIYGNDDRWRLLFDPYDDYRGEIGTVAEDVIAVTSGSWVPAMCTDYMDANNCDIAIVPAACGGTSITLWAPDTDHEDRTTLYGNANVRAQAAEATTGLLRGVLWWQGETDAFNAMSAATYQAALEAIAAAFATDLGGVKLYPCLLQNSSALSDVAEAAIRTGTTDAIAASANIEPGPDFSAVASDDDYHLMTDAKVLAAGQAWAAVLPAP